MPVTALALQARRNVHLVIGFSGLEMVLPRVEREVATMERVRGYLAIAVARIERVVRRGERVTTNHKLPGRELDAELVESGAPGSETAAANRRPNA
jgi:hypothetical protein